MFTAVKNEHAVALGRLGGAKGGAARAMALTPERRREIASRAASARARALNADRRRLIAEEAARARWSRVPDLVRPLFDSRLFKELRLPDHENVVLLHVLSYGDNEQIEWLRRRFGDARIRSWLRERRGWGIPGVAIERVQPWIAPREVSRWRQEYPAARISETRPLLTGKDAPEAVRRLLKSYDPAALLWADPDHRYAIVREIIVRGDQEARAWLSDIMNREQVRELVRRYRGAGCNEPERQKLRAEFGLSTDEIPERPYLGFQ